MAVAVLASCAGEPKPTGAISLSLPERAIATTTVPDLAGLRLDAANQVLAEAGIEDPALLDMAPRRRTIGGPEHWVVVQTAPRAGATLWNSGTLNVFLLRDREYEWFQEHPRMPKVSGGYGGSYDEDLGYGDEYLRYDGVLDPIRELVLIRYPRDYHTPRSKKVRSVPPYEPVMFDPSLERTRERKARAGLRAPKDGVRLRNTDRSWPRAGAKLRLGQLFIYFVKDEEKESERERREREAENDYHLYVDNDDDDFNVPGWLCPTRFC